MVDSKQPAYCTTFRQMSKIDPHYSTVTTFLKRRNKSNVLNSAVFAFHKRVKLHFIFITVITIYLTVLC